MIVLYVILATAILLGVVLALYAFLFIDYVINFLIKGLKWLQFKFSQTF